MILGTGGPGQILQQLGSTGMNLFKNPMVRFLFNLARTKGPALLNELQSWTPREYGISANDSILPRNFMQRNQAWSDGNALNGKLTDSIDDNQVQEDPLNLSSSINELTGFLAQTKKEQEKIWYALASYEQQLNQYQSYGSTNVSLFLRQSSMPTAKDDAMWGTIKNAGAFLGQLAKDLEQEAEKLAAVSDSIANWNKK